MTMTRVTLIILILTTWVTLATGQNLVPNPSLETYTNCPGNTNTSVSNAISWSAPTNNDADYFNACSSSIYAHIPFNGMYPRTGNAMAGIHGYNGIGYNYREYLQTPLTNTLQAGKCYYVEFYVNLYRHIRAAINNMAAHFSTNAINSTGTGYVLNVSSDILKFNNPIIYDTLNWTKISGIYQANGGEGYITIGNFKDDIHTDTLDTHYGNPWDAYYFVDDVSVIPTDSISLPPNAGNDTTITLGDSVFIGQHLYGLNCNWYTSGNLIATNVSGIFVHPTALTTYIVEQNLCGNITYDTVIVNIAIVGVKQNKKNNSINFYPNPTSDQSTLRFDNTKAELCTLTLYNNCGQIVRTLNNITSDQVVIQKNNLTNGLYYFVLRTGDRVIVTGKLAVD